MPLSFDSTVSALTSSIIWERCDGVTMDQSRSHDLVARSLLQSHAGMPDYLRMPLKCLTLVFDGWTLPFTGRPFHRLPHERRWRQVLAWRRSTLQFRRELVRFYESLVVFIWYEEVHGRDRS